MMDMLVRLYDLPQAGGRKGDAALQQQEALRQQGVCIRVARPYEMHLVANWVAEHFSPKWESECRIAFTREPVACYIATRESRILGFCCCDVTAKGFIGPMGIAEEERGRGIGEAVLLAAARSLAERGYAYAIIGGVGPAAFYERCLGATAIENSSPGIYHDILPEVHN